MNLQNSFNIIVNTVAITPLTKQERVNVEEALQVVVQGLNAYDVLKKQQMAAKSEIKPQLKPAPPKIAEAKEEEVKDA